MIRKILIGIAAVFMAFAVVIARRPSTFHVERSATMRVPADVPFAKVNDFHEWAAWSPYEKLDPQMTKTFSGSPSGVGAIYTWSGNDKAGEGKLTISESERPSRIVLRLDFTKPFANTNVATFTFASEGENTKVTWAMDGRYNFIAKAAGLFLDMDKLIGNDFATGLAAMTSLSEAKANRATSPVDSMH
jgi:hypothetical protein